MYKQILKNIIFFTKYLKWLQKNCFDNENRNPGINADKVELDSLMIVGGLLKTFQIINKA